MNQPDRVVEAMLTRRELRMIVAALHDSSNSMHIEAIHNVSAVYHSIKRDLSELADKVDRLFEQSEDAIYEEEKLQAERMRNVTTFGSLPNEPEPQFIACNPPQVDDGNLS